MGVNRIEQAHVIAAGTADPSQGFTELRLFNPDGSAWSGATVAAATTSVAGTVKKAAANADVSAPNATDLATAQTLANALKVTVNGLQAAMRTAGQLT